MAFNLQRFAEGGIGKHAQGTWNSTSGIWTRKLKYEMTKVLAERNLPVEFTDFLIAEDNEKTLERIKTFEKKYKKAIEDAVNEKLKGKTPPAGGGQSADVGKSIKNGFMQAIYDNQIKR